MKKVLIVCLLIITIGCAKKYTQPTEEVFPPEAPVKEDVLKPEAAEEMEEEVVEEVVSLEDDTVMESELALEEQAKEVFKDILFDYDKYDIRPDARPVLNTVSAFLGKNKEINIVIEGHCDDRGTNEYNLALGEKRSKAAKNYLVSLGVSPDRIIVITFGEEKPSCMEQNEDCWQNNRRAHFVVVKSRFQ